LGNKGGQPGINLNPQMFGFGKRGGKPGINLNAGSFGFGKVGGRGIVIN